MPYETVIERERRLMSAAKLYLRGEISYETMTAIRRASKEPAE